LCPGIPDAKSPVAPEFIDSYQISGATADCERGIPSLNEAVTVLGLADVSSVALTTTP